LLIRVYFLIFDPATDQIAHFILQHFTASDDDADGNRTFGMKAFEILKIAIKKRVLVIPFDLKSYHCWRQIFIPRKTADMVNFMRN